MNHEKPSDVVKGAASSGAGSQCQTSVANPKSALQDLGRLATHCADVIARNVRTNHKALASGQLEDVAGYLRDWDAEVRSLRAQRDELLAALKLADSELRLFMDAEAVCDHSVNICACTYNQMREAMRAALAKAGAA